MPGKVKVKIISGRNLPVMDRSSDTTDAYVEIKLGSTTYKTDVCRKSLHPQWNSEWYRFEVDDSELQDEPLQIRLMDHDTYSANDAIGKVYLDLNPLLLPAASLLLKWNSEGVNSHESPSNSVMSGWIPVYDTMHGIRGEVNITVKVELFSDFNKFRQSSCGVQFFCSPVIPHGYYAQVVHGFVEELVVNDDPEYQWIDKIRTPRASNEARQTLFFKLSGELQRKIGVKALDLGGNAVIGYTQCFDLEGESGIVARGIGTAVTLVKMIDIPNPNNQESNTTEERAQSYLKFLGSAKGFFLNSDSDIKEKVSHPIPSPAPSIKSLKLELIPEFSTDHLRHLSDKDSSPKIHHSPSLQTLLKQEDNRGRPSYGFSQTFRNLKYSSQNLLNKRITAMKTKKIETDNSDTVDAKKRHAYKYRRTQSDSTGMAEILVRSISQATASLDCIVETHDSSPPQIAIHEEPSEASDFLNDVASNSYLSLPDTSITHSSNASSTSSDTSSLDEEDNLELDTISNIVETVRKLSMNQAPVTDDDDKLLFIVGDLELDRSDENFNTSETLEPDNISNVDTISLDAQSVITNRLFTTHQQCYPQISKTFQFIKKSPTVHSLSEIEKPLGLSTKFTSLHNIHDACSKINKYSLHGGKETVLGELFKRVSSGPNSPTIEEEDTVLGEHFKRVCSEPNTPTIEEEFSLDDVENFGKEEKHGFLEMIKERKEKIMHGPKVLFHRLDSRIHKEEESNIKNHHGLLETALGNVLIDSMNEILATSHGEDSAEKTKEKTDDCNSPDSMAISVDVGSNVGSNKEVGVKTKTFKEKIFNVPKAFFQRLDSKIHKKDTEVKDEGLLGTALENVLMDSVNEILATSHPNLDPPKTSNFEPDLIVKPVNTEIDTGNSVSINIMHACLTNLRNTDPPPTETRHEIGHQRAESAGTRIAHSPAKLNSIPCIHRRSSDSDLSITPKGNSLTGSDRSGGCSSGQFMRNAIIRSTVPQENFDIMEYPFLTMSKYPIGFIAFIGGSVSARSVKLLERITNIEEPESRDTWWSEIRMEIRSHARALNCNAVLGYTETTSICDDVCVLSASGTAAVIGYQYAGEANDNICGLPIIPKSSHKDMMTTSLDRNDFEKEKIIKVDSVNKSSGGSPERESVVKQACTICHLPYLGNSVPLRNSTSKCCICRSGKVPDVLIATIEIPEGIPSVGRGCFVQSYVCRHLRDLKGESNAKEISDGLPFLEYELHRLLINKLKVKGMNAVFGLKVRISIGERMLIGIATGTAVFLTPLPTPPLPKLVSDRTTDEKKLAQIQKSLHDTVKKNREIYQLRNLDEANGKLHSDTDDSEDEQASLDLSVGNKDCCILEVDDPEDVDVLNSIMEPRPPDGFHVVNTELVPGLEELEIVKNLQMFTQIWRAKLQPPYNLDKHFHRLLQSVYFKLRRMIPCALCDLQFRVDSPEPDEIQLCVLGMALGLGDPQKKIKRKIMPKRNDDDLIFNLEEDQIPENSVVKTPPNPSYLHTQTLKHRQKSPIRNRFITRQRHVPYRERHGVDITPLSYVPGGKIEKYLGNLNFFFIRETTSIREEGGLSGFIHSFVTEILAIVRAHVTALGGNAMVAYFITECVLNHNLHKNQGQCLINVGGDVVYVTYYSEDH